ncbi:MAG: carboxypeptidase regulatory-like domain-containing protein [Terriglobia bacterium]
MTCLRKATLFSTACFLSLTALAYGQFESAEVLGTVRDTSGATIAGATVTLTNLETGIQSQGASDASGDYDFFNVKVGRYSLAVEKTGFEKFTTKDVRVDVNARQRVDAALQVGAVTQSVEVTGAAATLDTDSSEHGEVVNTQQIVELPLNGRNYSDLALLTTNVHRSIYAYAVPPREGAFNVNGMRSTYNSFLLDGVDNNAYSTSNQGYSNEVAQPSPDAIAEFKVITSNYSAEYGRVGGAVVNAATRSGTNQIHGTAYEFLRNTDLNAVGFIFVPPPKFVKPTLQRNQFGGTVGGPIVKNKLFFFGDYEGYRSLQRTYTFDTIPDASDREGVLPVPVVDPAVINPSTGLPTVYPAGTALPVSANGFAAQVLSQLPTVGATRSNDFQALLLTRDFYDKFDTKVDYQINNKMSAFVRYSQRKDGQYYEPDLDPSPSGGSGNGNVKAQDENAVLGYTYTVNANSLLDARLAFSHILGGKFPVFLGGQSMTSEYGVPGLPTEPFLTGGLNTQNIGGYSTVIGRQATNPQFQNPTSWDPKVNYSWMHGRHAVKIGFEMGIIHTEVMDINPVYGLDAYSGQFSKPTCAELGKAAGCSITSDSASYGVADFIFGLPSQVQLANYLVGNYRQRQYFFYGQDDYRVSSKLTLNLGLRWEFATPRWERDNVLSNFDPTTNTILTAQNGSLFDRTLVHPDYRDWAPRLGVAYSADQKTVIRSGYGISYVHLERLGSADELGINGPQVDIATVNQALVGGKVPSGFMTSYGGFPAGFASAANFNPVNANISYIPANTRWPYVQSWFFSVQRELAKDTVLEIAYTGNHSLRLPILGDYNQALPNAPGGTLGIQPRRPDQAFGAITFVDPAGFQNYNGLSLRFEHKTSLGLYFLNSFTWSKSLTDSEQALEYGSGYYAANVQNIYDLSNERGPSSLDAKFINTTSFVYELPFGQGRKFGSTWNSVVDGILGGWEVDTINTANSGTPLDVAYTPSATNDVTGRIPDYRGEAIMRPNVVPNPGGVHDQINHYYGLYTFTTPPASDPFGNVGRNSFRGPDFWQWDLGVDKFFRIRENLRLQFRSEYFNALNHTNLGIPDSNTSDAAFGTIRSTFPARQIQFALKVLF